LEKIMDVDVRALIQAIAAANSHPEPEGWVTSVETEYNKIVDEANKPAVPDQGLPGSGPKPDQGLPKPPTSGSGPKPDQGLPKPPPDVPDNTLPEHAAPKKK
jgi:hypothetical protein